MPLIPAIRTALAYAGDLPRALATDAIDHAWTRAFEVLTSILPTRTIATAAGDPYLGRTYLAGRQPKGFGELRTVLDACNGTAYVHRFHRADLEPEHHSHPWEWAVSIVLPGSGGYVEEVVLADGSVVTRERPPGSVAMLTASTFHRVSELRGPAVHTLFITGPRTQDGRWYFRRLNGAVVPHDVFLAEREAERAREGVASVRARAEADAEEWARRGWLEVEPGETAIEALGRGLPPIKVTRPRRRPGAYHCSTGARCEPPFTAFLGCETIETRHDALDAFAAIRPEIQRAHGSDPRRWPRVKVLDSWGRTVMPPIDAKLGPDPYDPTHWEFALEHFEVGP